MSIDIEQEEKRAIEMAAVEVQPIVEKRTGRFSILRYLPGLALLVLAGVLYSRAGYGPFGDPAQRGQPCTVSRCPHNATAVLVAGIAALALPRAVKHKG